MSETEKQDIQTAETPAQMAAVVAGASRSRRGSMLVWGSVILTLVSWITAALNPWVGVVVAAAAVTAGAFGIKGRNRGAMRNLGITSIIAASVLLVVIVSFLIVIYFGLQAAA